MQTACATLHLHLCPVPYISTLPHKWHNFWEKVIEYKMCFDFPYNLCLKQFVLWRIQQDIVINVHRSSGEVPVILVILMKLNFSGQIFKKYSNFMKMHPMGAECHADRWTDIIKLTVAFTILWTHLQRYQFLGTMFHTIWKSVHNLYLKKKLH